MKDAHAKDSVSVAVIGAGYWGKKIIGEYLQMAKSNPKVSLSMVCDSMDENLTYCNEVLHVPQSKLVRDYRKVLCSNDVNSVHICTPNETHFQIGKEALQADKHVLLEKPISLHAKQAWELVGIAKSSGLILQVGHIFRFNNALKMMRDLIAHGYLGDLYYLKLQWTTLMPSPLNRDIIFDLGPHPIDIVNYLLGKWPVKVVCKGRAYRRKSLEELAYITLEFERDLMAHIELSWLQPGKVREATIVGSERSAVVDCLNQSVGIYENGDRDRFNLDVVANNTILEEVNHFAESIQVGHNSNNSGSVGARNVAILESLRRSLEDERTIEVELREEDERHA
jgi:UDP-N-acetylglucosamine 3-dehydrogenase